MEVASWRTTIYYLMETFTSQSGWRKAKKNENTCFFVALQGSWRSSNFAPNQHKYNNTYITITCTSIQVNDKSLYLFFRHTYINNHITYNVQTHISSHTLLLYMGTHTWEGDKLVPIEVNIPKKGCHSHKPNLLKKGNPNYSHKIQAEYHSSITLH